MDDSIALKPKPPTPSTTLRGRNSTAPSVVVPRKLTLPATSPSHMFSFQAYPNVGITTSADPEAAPPHLDLELDSLRSSFFSYTSLKDVLPSFTAAINSPTGSVVMNSGYEVSIRNRLVKQAAWAYLQPMSTSPDSSSGKDFVRRLWQKVSSDWDNPFLACFSFVYHQIIPGIAQIFYWILRAIRGLAGR